MRATKIVEKSMTQNEDQSKGKLECVSEPLLRAVGKVSISISIGKKFLIKLEEIASSTFKYSMLLILVICCLVVVARGLPGMPMTLIILIL